MRRPPYPREITLLPIPQEGMWAPEPVWKVLRKRNPIARAEIRTPYRPASSESLYRLRYPGSRVPGITNFRKMSCVYVRLNWTRQCYIAILGYRVHSLACSNCRELSNLHPCASKRNQNGKPKWLPVQCKWEPTLSAVASTYKLLLVTHMGRRILNSFAYKEVFQHSMTYNYMQNFIRYIYRFL